MRDKERSENRTGLEKPEFRERIENKTQIVDKEKGEKERYLIKGFLGRDVIVVLRGKVKVKGKLETVSQYEIILTVSEKPVLIMKHAVDYIELTETKTS